MKKVISFVKKESVLCISAVISLISCFFVTPDAEYLSYIDFRTLSLLFCLMAVMSGFKGAKIFSFFADRLVRITASSRGLLGVLTLLCFFSSTLITNDVALITFVPFSITVLTLTKLVDMIPLAVVLQTVAANMGSCLTPIGNPQNIYFYSISDISFWELFLLLLPYALVTLVCLTLIILFTKNTKIHIKFSQKIAIDLKPAIIFSILFILSILSVMKIIPAVVCLGVTLLVLLIYDRKILLKIDYSLLITFVCFFVFVGNMGRISVFKEFIEQMILDKEILFSALASQIISNLPAALLLSGFTKDYSALLVGVNIGGVGTLVASMASLISYKYIDTELPKKKGLYLLIFTAVNFALLIVLLGISTIL